jgi:hypothetical protein
MDLPRCSARPERAEGCVRDARDMLAAMAADATSKGLPAAAPAWLGP